MDDIQKEKAKEMYAYYTGIPLEAIISVHYNQMFGLIIKVAFDNLDRFISVGPIMAEKGVYTDTFKLEALVSAFDSKIVFNTPYPVQRPLTIEDVKRLA